MNIIEAFQRAEQGALLTNGFLKSNNRFLKYMGSGVFSEFEIRGGKAEYKYEVRQFRVAHIISIDWEVVENIYFKK